MMLDIIVIENIDSWGDVYLSGILRLIQQLSDSQRSVRQVRMIKMEDKERICEALMLNTHDLNHQVYTVVIAPKELFVEDLFNLGWKRSLGIETLSSLNADSSLCWWGVNRRALLIGMCLPILDAAECIKIINNRFQHKQSVCKYSIYCFGVSLEILRQYTDQLIQQYEGLSMFVSDDAGIVIIRIISQVSADAVAVRDAFISRFSLNIFSMSQRSVAKVLQDFMLDQKYTLAIAESCTGGSIASRITHYSGSSGYFLGSVVAYHNTVKQKVLNVSDLALQPPQGPVSRDVVEEMSKNVRSVLGSDYGAAVSGVAGPLGGSKGCPVGTVWAAIATPTQVFSGLIDVHPQWVKERNQWIDYTVNYLLFSLYRYLNRQVEPFV